MLGFSCADFVIVVKISRVGFTENCGVNAGHSQLVFDGLNLRGQMNSISIFT